MKTYPNKDAVFLGKNVKKHFSRKNEFLGREKNADTGKKRMQKAFIDELQIAKQLFF